MAALKNGFAVCFCHNYPQVDPEIMSYHRTFSGAERAFRRRNRHLYDRRFAEQHGMQNTGTFDRIMRLENGELIADVPSSDY